MPQPEILPTHTPALFAFAVHRAVQALGRGEVVALPTETVYGLAANALEPQAVRRIFEIKGRPAHNPIIVHVADLAMARRCASEWPALGDSLAAAFWPGPLTLVVKRSPEIPNVVTAGGDTVGVRWPSHPFMQAVIRQCGFPLAAPSANRSNEISPTNAIHVARGLRELIPLVIDGGQSQVGIESTVLDLTVSPPRVLRPGMIHHESLMSVTGELDSEAAHADGPLRSPGLLRKHYSPKARLIILAWHDEADFGPQLARALAKEHLSIAPERIFVIAHTHIPLNAGVGRISVIPHDAEAFARAIYSELHSCDEAQAELIVVEALPENAHWQAVADRLNRAAAHG